MANDSMEVVVRPEGFEEITGLIDILSDVAEQATAVVKAWDNGLYPPMKELKARLLLLNDYVDEHLDDD